MKLSFGSIILSDGLIASASGLVLNGTQVNDRADFVRASYAAFYPRGLRAHSLSFRVSRTFDTPRLAARFALEHFKTLPEQGALALYIGTIADGEWASSADAVLNACSPRAIGLSCEVEYSFSLSEITLDAADPGLTEPDSSMIKRATTAITSGASSVAVTFAAPFASVPVVTCSMQSPSGGDAIFAWVRDGSVSTTGFTADLSAPVPASGYKLSWQAAA